jgi:arsenate reductase-like glutaredoxin family protein
MNKILAFSIAILLLGIQKISAQNYLNYYETINKAEIANLDGNFKKSDSLYQTAFGLVVKPFKEDYLLASVNSEKLNDNSKTFDYLKKGISNGLTLKRIKKILTEFQKSKEWKELNKEYDSLRENHLKTLNLPLRKEIKKMLAKDQASRHPIFGSGKKLKKVDNYNFNRLLEIIKENGGKWIGFSTIGEILPKGKYDVTGNIALMILHFNKKQIEQLKPYMIQAVMEGEMYPYHFARAIDYKNNCQIYGTYIDGGYLFEICDCENAEKERKKIGFEPIADYYRKRNSKFKCGEKK